MTPLFRVEHCATWFETHAGAYNFTVPFWMSDKAYVQRMRELAKKRGYRWKISHVSEHWWIVKQKTP